MTSEYEPQHPEPQSHDTQTLTEALYMIGMIAWLEILLSAVSRLGGLGKWDVDPPPVLAAAF